MIYVRAESAATRERSHTDVWQRTCQEGTLLTLFCSVVPNRLGKNVHELKVLGYLSSLLYSFLGWR